MCLSASSNSFPCSSGFGSLCRFTLFHFPLNVIDCSYSSLPFILGGNLFASLGSDKGSTSPSFVYFVETVCVYVNGCCTVQFLGYMWKQTRSYIQNLKRG